MERRMGVKRMADLINRMIEYTKDSRIIWHKMKSGCNITRYGKERFVEYFQVAHCKRKDCGFGSMSIGSKEKNKNKILYLHHFFEAGIWLDINADGEFKTPIENLFSLVKKVVIKKRNCPECKKLHKIFSEQYK